jgi:mono/diheme cytochrome c family protein/uncharacterized membrane protein
LAGLLLLLTVAAGSHAAGEPDALLAVASDWVHLSAAAFWVGGLTFLVAGLAAGRGLESADRTRLAAGLIPRFSAVGLLSVSALVLTGLYASLLHVGTLTNLTGSPYGRALLFKLALVAPMVGLGAINLLVTSPAMRRAAAGGGNRSLVSRFRQLVGSELTLGAGVLVGAALLTSLPPAQTHPGGASLSGVQEVDNLEIALEISPGRLGLNTFMVMVEQDGRPLDDAREVSMQLTPAGGALPPSSARLEPQGDGQYMVEGGFLALPDNWQVQVAVRRPDAFDAFANFDFAVGMPAMAAAGGAAVPWYRLSGPLLLALGPAFGLAAASLTGRRGLRLGLAPAALLFLSGLAVLAGAPGGQPAYPVNPIAPNAASVAAGEPLYRQNCLPCHGESGAGDGPVGLTLNPPPADLRVHMVPGVHPDGRLYDWITHGFPNSVMPAFEDAMSDEERWHVVNYIRTLAQE